MDKVVIFGRGRYFEEKKDALFDEYEIKEIWDSSLQRGTSCLYESVPVLNPADADKSGNESILLLSVHFVDMWKTLVSLEIRPERMVVPYDMPQLFENDEAVSHCVKGIEFTYDEVVITSKADEIYRVHDESEWHSLLRTFYRETYPVINAISQMNTHPVSEQFATERGMPIDRYYVELFLKKNKHFIKGTVLEIEDNSYTRLFGGDDCDSIVMDVSSQSETVDFIANLETGKGIRERITDCFICTQTLMYLYDLKRTADSIYRLLKPEGVALITCSGISQNSRRCMDNYGCTFNYNTDALRLMFGDTDRFEILDIGSYGNVKTVSAHIVGLCQEDLNEDDFSVNDKYYPLVVYAAVRRVS